MPSRCRHRGRARPGRKTWRKFTGCLAWTPQSERVVADQGVVMVESGDCVCRIGRPVTHWFGVVDGLLKMSNGSTSTA